MTSDVLHEGRVHRRFSLVQRWVTMTMACHVRSLQSRRSRAIGEGEGEAATAITSASTCVTGAQGHAPLRKRRWCPRGHRHRTDREVSNRAEDKEGEGGVRGVTHSGLRKPDPNRRAIGPNAQKAEVPTAQLSTNRQQETPHTHPSSQLSLEKTARATRSMTDGCACR